MAKVATETPDAFQVALAELAGLDPANVLADSLAVEFDRGPNGMTATLTARVSVSVDPNEVTRLAMKHDRIKMADRP